jgi:hypothetical protein
MPGGLVLSGFGVVWLDYCGTLGASAKAARPRYQDIELLLSEGLLLFHPKGPLARQPAGVAESGQGPEMGEISTLIQ